MPAILIARANDDGRGSAAPSRRWLVYLAMCRWYNDFPRPWFSV